MRKRRWGETGLYVLAVLLMFGVLSSNAGAAMTSSFHGFFESNFVLRDTTGIQNGFFDQAEGVQQRNTLKFDVDIDPNIEMGAFRVEKVHLTFRGAYDSIFDLRANEYKIKESLGASRFDYGLKDIRFETDLREAFIDFAFKSKSIGTGFFRPGRQIVSWGEGMLETLLDVVNPADQSFKLFFQNPDDVKIPLWMGRLNYSPPRFIPSTDLNFDLLWIPDIRPAQLGPLDSVGGQPGVGLQAPYVRVLPFSDFDGLTVRQKAATNEQEYGGRITAMIGDRLSLSFTYFRDVNNDGGVVLSNFYTGPTATFTYNKQHVYGGYFSYQLLMGGFEAIVRGEVSHYTAAVINRDAVPFGNWAFIPGVGPVPLDDQAGLKSFEYKPVTKTMLAIDKDMRWRWLSPHDVTKISFEWVHKTINEWNSDFDNTWYAASGAILKDRRHAREQDVFLMQVMTFWWASKLNPMLIVACSPGKHGDGTTYMVQPSIKWYITSQLYTNMALQAFMGDKHASYDFSTFVPTSEANISLGYEW